MAGDAGVGKDFGSWLIALVILGFPLYLAGQNKLANFAELV